MSIRLSHKPGDIIDPGGTPFEILEHIQTGGMGTVYKALKINTGNLFAVKECDLLDDPRGKQISRAEAIEIFHREGRHIESLKCSGIPTGFLHEFPQKDLRICLKCGNPTDITFSTCTICQPVPGTLYYHPQEIEKRYYLFMDYIKGEDMDERVRSIRPLQSRSDALQVVEWMKSAGETIRYIHEKDFIHRDIKPQNIRLSDTDGQVYLLDFGLLRETSSGASQSVQKRMTSVMGTDGYAPPEQIRGDPCKASDVYALTMTLMELLSGLKPDDPADRERILREDPRSLVSFISSDLADMIKRSLSSNERHRPFIAEWLSALDDPFARGGSRAKSTRVMTGPIPGSSVSGARTTPPRVTRRPPPRKSSQTPDPSTAGSVIQKSVYFIMAGVFVLVVIFFSFLTDHESTEYFKAEARSGAIIFSDVKKSAVLKRLSGGERLSVVQNVRYQGAYWFEVRSVNGSSEGGYIPRGMVNIYE